MARTAFPIDLLQAQRDFNRVYASLERRPVQTASLRRRLHQLSVRVAIHPFWETEAGRSPAARVELRRRARELEEIEDLLTDRQRQILTCIRQWVAEHGAPPTLREIGQAVGLSSTASVSHQLTNLEQFGVIERRGKGKGIALRG